MGHGGGIESVGHPRPHAFLPRPLAKCCRGSPGDEGNVVVVELVAWVALDLHLVAAGSDGRQIGESLHAARDGRDVVVGPGISCCNRDGAGGGEMQHRPFAGDRCPGGPGQGGLDLLRDLGGTDPVLGDVVAAGGDGLDRCRDGGQLAIDGHPVGLAVVGGLYPHQGLVSSGPGHGRCQRGGHRRHPLGVGNEGEVGDRRGADLSGRVVGSREIGVARWGGHRFLVTFQVEHPNRISPDCD